MNWKEKAEAQAKDQTTALKVEEIHELRVATIKGKLEVISGKITTLNAELKSFNRAYDKAIHSIVNETDVDSYVIGVVNAKKAIKTKEDLVKVEENSKKLYQEILDALEA